MVLPLMLETGFRYSEATYFLCYRHLAVAHCYVHIYVLDLSCAL